MQRSLDQLQANLYPIFSIGKLLTLYNSQALGIPLNMAMTATLLEKLLDSDTLLLTPVYDSNIETSAGHAPTPELELD